MDSSFQPTEQQLEMVDAWFSELEAVGPQRVAQSIEKAKLTLSNSMIMAIALKIMPKDSEVENSIQLVETYQYLNSSPDLDKYIAKLSLCIFHNFMLNIKHFTCICLDNFANQLCNQNIANEEIIQIITINVEHLNLLKLQKHLCPPETWDICSSYLYSLTIIRQRYIDVYFSLIKAHTADKITANNNNSIVQMNRLIRIQYETYYQENGKEALQNITQTLNELFPARDTLPIEAKKILKSKIKGSNCGICKEDRVAIAHWELDTHNTKWFNQIRSQTMNDILKKSFAKESSYKLIGTDYCILCLAKVINMQEHVEKQQHKNDDKLCLVCGIIIQESSLSKHFCTPEHKIVTLSQIINITPNKDINTRLITYTQEMSKRHEFQVATEPKISNWIFEKKNFVHAKQIRRNNKTLIDLNQDLKQKLKAFVKEFLNSEKPLKFKSILLKDLGLSHLFYEDVFHILVGCRIYEVNLPEIIIPMSDIKSGLLISQTKTEYYDKLMQIIFRSKIPDELMDGLQLNICRILDSDFIPLSLMSKCLKSFNIIAENY